MLAYLIDEHLLHLVTRLRRLAPELVVVGIGDPGAPERGTPDPALLRWCERHDLVLVSADDRTLCRHVEDHLAAGHTSPGVLLINPGLSDAAALELLVLAAGVLAPAELRNQLRFLGAL